MLMSQRSITAFFSSPKSNNHVASDGGSTEDTYSKDPQQDHNPSGNFDFDPHIKRAKLDSPALSKRFSCCFLISFYASRYPPMRLPIPGLI